MRELMWAFQLRWPHLSSHSMMVSRLAFQGASYCKWGVYRALSSTRSLSLTPIGNALQGETVRIGCSSGFWGDTATAAPQLVHHGKIDYLVSDYLAEITMSLLTAAKNKSPDFGYTPDFVQTLKPLLKEVKKRGVKVISNAGGVNPEACAAALNKIAKEQGVELSVAMVTGDSLMYKMDEVKALGVEDMYHKNPLPKALHSMNAYLGAFPIAEALGQGADIVITGRCVDSALALAPLIHEFGWSSTDFDKLAAGSLAGHLIECGAQATGGIFTDWDKVKGWENMGFPIVECSRDGDFILTKPPNTGGLVSKATVAEQLVYEIGDPKRYILPDVICDFSNVQIEELTSGDSVLVTGARGGQPTDDYKVSATYADGFKAVAVCGVVGPRSAQKAEKTANAILKRTRAIFKYMGLEDYSQTNVHLIGTESSYGHQYTSPREVMLWLAVKHKEKKALEVFSREIAPAGTGMAPGFAMLVGGRPKVAPVLRLFSFLYPKSQLPVTLHLNGEPMKTESYPSPDPPPSTPSRDEDTAPVEPVKPVSGSHSYRLEELAYLRSGDKGDSTNIGVIARHPSYLPFIRQQLSSDAVRNYFEHFLEEDSTVERYDLPGIDAVNFVLTKCLGGGGVSSLRFDPQGKAYAQMLADFTVSDMPSLKDLNKT